MSGFPTYLLESMPWLALRIDDEDVPGYLMRNLSVEAMEDTYWWFNWGARSDNLPSRSKDNA